MTTMQHIDTELYNLLDAVSFLSHQKHFGPADLERLIGFYNQAAYLFTYIEGNAKYIDVSASFTGVKAALLEDTDLRSRLASRIRKLITETNSVARDQTGVLEWFLQPCEQILAEAEMRTEIDRVKDLLTRIDLERAALLAQLGIEDGSDSTTAMVTMLQHINEQSTRSKLLFAWQKVGEGHTNELTMAMDQLVEQRWRYATAFGYRSVAERGFTSCGVSEETVRTFLETYSGYALRERQVFLSLFECRSMLDDRGREISLLASERNGEMSLGQGTVNLNSLLKLIADTVKRIFGITLCVQPGDAGTIEGFNVTKQAHTLGTLLLDRVLVGSRSVLAPKDEITTLDCPRARILCLMSSHETVSFEAARQILHAMGHALVHIVSRPRVPSTSGLDILPLERLEGLSHWFETLIDNNVFEEHVAVTQEQRITLEAFRLARDKRARNIRLEQAIVALIDLNLHTRRGCSVQGLFDSQIASMGSSVGISFERVIQFMTAPLFRDHPGMGFVYPWGTAFGSTMAHPSTNEHLSKKSLTAYFDFNTTIALPTFVEFENSYSSVTQ